MYVARWGRGEADKAILCGNLQGRDHLENVRCEVNNGLSRIRIEEWVELGLD